MARVTRPGKIHLLAIAAIIICVALISISCGGAPAPGAVEEERMPPSVVVVPNSVAPSAPITVIGANFSPKEKVKVAILIMRAPGYPLETILTVNEKIGLYTEANDIGSFKFDTTVPNQEGVMPIRVYDEEGKMIAATLVVVQVAKK